MIVWAPDQQQTTRRYRGKHRKQRHSRLDIVLCYAAFVAVPTALGTVLAVALDQR